LSEHLTRVQIEQYVSRSAPVDEILSAAQHLNECFDCRDHAVALVDPGGDISHTRPASGPIGRPVEVAQRVLTPWVIAAAFLAAVITIAIMLWTR